MLQPYGQHKTVVDVLMFSCYYNYKRRFVPKKAERSMCLSRPEIVPEPFCFETLGMLAIFCTGAESA